MYSFKILAAAAAAATVSLAMAQGVPPKPAADPAIGAGQRSTQNTPMGTTGTPGSKSGAMAQGSYSGSTAAPTTGNMGASGSMNSGSSMNSTSNDSSTMASSSSGSSTHKTTKHKKSSKKMAKADRN
jgi:hypothetical protein